MLPEPDVKRMPAHRRRSKRSFLAALQASGEQPANDLGQRLRELRQGSGYSLRSLAEKSSLNVNTLSMIENGKTSPSVATLQQLALALEMPITSFFQSQAPQKRIAFHKAGQRRSVAFACGVLEDLGEGMLCHGAEPFLVTLEPLAESGTAPIVHTGREFVYCLAGSLAYTIEEQTYVLEPGDSLLFDACLPHRWQNVSHSRTRSLLVLCPADENDHPTEMHFVSDI